MSFGPGKGRGRVFLIVPLSAVGPPREPLLHLQRRTNLHLLLGKKAQSWVAQSWGGVQGPGCFQLSFSHAVHLSFREYGVAKVELLVVSVL